MAMFSRLKSALAPKSEPGAERAGLRGALVEKLRGMRGGDGAAPPEAPIVRAVSPPTPAVAAKPVPAVVPLPVVVPAPVAAEEPAPVAAAKPVPAVVPAPAAEPPVQPPVAASAPAKPKPSLAALAAAAGTHKAEANKIVHADMGSTDLEHYIARAKANGRDLSTIKGGEGLNVGSDGGKFWGPVENESSTAKANGKLLTIDQWECISCGTCVEQTDKVFYLPADAKATPIAQDGPMDLIQDAIEACPVTCIHWVTPDEAAEKGLATGNEPDSPRPD